MRESKNCIRCENNTAKENGGAKYRLKKMLAMYATMVTVSTVAIFLLEHVTFSNAIRTALVAAVAKTFAANWVSALFQ